MERLKGRNSTEEEYFQFLDDCRKNKMSPDAAVRALSTEFVIEPRIAMIILRRHTSCFPDPK